VAIASHTELGTGNEISVALAYDNKGRIIAWLGLDSDLEIYRAVVDPVTLKRLSLKRIFSNVGLTESLQAVQPLSSLLAFDMTEGIQRGFRMFPNGLPAGTSIRLHPRFEDSGAYHDSSIAADGRMSMITYEVHDVPNFVAVQPLNTNNKPVGDPEIIAQPPCAYESDLTSLLPNGRRFVVYINCTNGDDIRTLNVVDGTTGQRIGGPVTIDTTHQVGEANQSMAIDPEGRFLIYNVRGVDAGCPSERDPLFFIPLNPNTGNPSGSPKQITPCNMYDPFVGGGHNDGVFGIDILKVF
jgi:hypothetical protein